jgi:hypothetical protein
VLELSFNDGYDGGDDGDDDDNIISNNFEKYFMA